MRIKRQYVDHEFFNLELTEKMIVEWSFFDCQFRNCNFSRSRLKFCQFEACKFFDCNISSTVLGRSQFIDTSFTDCKILGIDWPEASSPIELSFLRSLLDYNIFSAQNLSGLILKECSARNVFFQECNLSRANFTGTDLTDTNFEDCKLNHADLSGVKNLSVNLDSNDLTHAVLSVESALNLLREYKIIIR